MTTTEASPPAVIELRSPPVGLRRLKDVAFKGFLLTSLALALGVLLTLLVDLIMTGRTRFNWQLVSNMPSARPARAGIQSAIFGSIWVVALTAAISLPLGVGAALYLEEFAHKDRWYNRFIELNIQNLAGVPSIVYGILGLAFVARGSLGWGFTVRTAALILSMVVLPTVVIASREADTRCAEFAATGRIGSRRDAMADGVPPGAPCGGTRYSDREHPRHITCAR